MSLASGAAWLAQAVAAQAQGIPQASRALPDAELARSLGAVENGMRRYVLVVLETGPSRSGAPAALSKGGAPLVRRPHAAGLRWSTALASSKPTGTDVCS